MPTPLTLLLVDDDVFNREGLRLYLEREGFRLLEAGDEASAWALALGQPPDVAVVDISIPPDTAAEMRAGRILRLIWAAAASLFPKRPNKHSA
jgi:CheY-like chemotaxis protein